MAPEALVTILGGQRYSLGREKETQAEIAASLDERSIPHEREVDLGGRNIIDFMVGRTGIEVKIAAPKQAIFRQCKRYCETGRLSALVLASNTAIGFPAEIAGVPCFVVSLGRAWL